ncbi:MAG TPA: DUF3127 domain-containing protein [Catalimonadaceae bacterium]|nr:DUF3127 domain-containing protein [Catalimonadaceae bacterium]
MDISGTIIQILPEESGTAKNGNTWRKQYFVIETKDQFPKKVCIQAWGEKIDQFGLQIGDDATVSFDIESREYNGKWYTDVKAWKVQKGTSAPPTQSNNSPVYQPVDSSRIPPPMEDNMDDLPF